MEKFECNISHTFSKTKDFNVPTLEIGYTIELGNDDLHKEIRQYLEKNAEKRLQKLISKQLADIQGAIDDAQKKADAFRSIAKKAPQTKEEGVAVKNAIVKLFDFVGTPNTVGTAQKLLAQGVKVLDGMASSECESIKKAALGSVSKARQAEARKLKLKGTGKAVLKGSFYATAGLISIAATVATGGTGFGLAFGAIAATTSAVNSTITVWKTVNSELKSEEKIISQIHSTVSEISAQSKKLEKLKGELETHQKKRIAKSGEAYQVWSDLALNADKIVMVHPKFAAEKKKILSEVETMSGALTALEEQSEETEKTIKQCESVIDFNKELSKNASGIKDLLKKTLSATDKAAGVGKSANIVVSKLDNFKANMTALGGVRTEISKLVKSIS